MMINIHRRLLFDPLFTDFWNSSFEAEIDDYARELLIPNIDDRLVVPPQVNTSLSDEDRFELYFDLDRQGRLIQTNVRKTSAREDFNNAVEKVDVPFSNLIIVADNLEPPPTSMDEALLIAAEFIDLESFHCPTDSADRRYLLQPKW